MGGQEGQVRGKRGGWRDKDRWGNGGNTGGGRDGRGTGEGTGGWYR